MSNNLHDSVSARCKCGRYISVGESISVGCVLGNYTCPNCMNPHLTRESLTTEEYYRQMGIIK